MVIWNVWAARRNRSVRAVRVCTTILLILVSLTIIFGWTRFLLHWCMKNFVKRMMQRQIASGCWMPVISNPVSSLLITSWRWLSILILSTLKGQLTTVPNGCVVCWATNTATNIRMWLILSISWLSRVNPNLWDGATNGLLISTGENGLRIRTFRLPTIVRWIIVWANTVVLEAP